MLENPKIAGRMLLAHSYIIETWRLFSHGLLMRLDTPRYCMALLDLDPAHDIRLSVLVPASIVPPPAFANPHAYLAMNL